MRCALLALPCLLFLIVAPRPAHADTVASLLGNYTVNQFARIKVQQHRIKLHFVVVYGQLPALTALHKADSNNDGVTSEAERDAYAKKLAPGFARKLKLKVGSRPIPLKLVKWTSSLPSESTGFSLRLDARYVGELPAGLAPGAVHHLKFDNTNYTGRIGWHEIVVKPGSGMSVFDTNAHSTSLTDGLSVNPEKLPPSGPLNERRVHLAFTQGPVPAGAAPIAPRKGEKIAAGSGSGQRSGIRATGVSATWLNQATKSLVDLISAKHVAPSVMALALLVALVLGALHAFSPGHGKTVVGAYLIGSRGTIRHAVFLGITVTVTHTLGVFALGLATLLASQFVVPAKLFPILSLVSGLLVVVIGLTLFVRRLRGGGHHHAHSHAPADAKQDANEVERPVEVMAENANAAPRSAEPASARALSPAWAGATVAADAPHPHTHEHGHRHVHGHAHQHEHVHAHDHAHGHGGLTHSHGGSTHTHLPPGAEGDKVTWKSLLGLGISGGLIPCPSAMVLLLATIAMRKTALGLVLVFAFSIGLAITLTGVGAAFLYARRLFGRARVPGRLVQALPVISAGIITCIGIVICYGAIAGVSIRV